MLRGFLAAKGKRATVAARLFGGRVAPERRLMEGEEELFCDPQTCMRRRRRLFVLLGGWRRRRCQKWVHEDLAERAKSGRGAGSVREVGEARGATGMGLTREGGSEVS